MQTAPPNPVPGPVHTRHLPKHVSPANAKKKSVSAASVFKQAPKKSKAGSKVISSNTRVTLKDTRIQKSREAKSPPITRSPQKISGDAQEVYSDRHPLELAFKETTQGYRRHVYNTVATKIDTIHSSLIVDLDAATARFVAPTNSPSSHPYAPQTLAIGQQIDALNENICTQPSTYRMIYRHTDEETGGQECIETTFGDRIIDYIAHVKREEKAFKDLQTKWEIVVGEIWKLGVQTLGSDRMSEFLVQNPSPAPPPSPMQMAAELDALSPDEEALPCNGKRPRKTKKSVSFKDPMPIPNFLTGPSRLKVPVPQTPEVDKESVSALKRLIDELGAEEVATLRKAEREHSQWWAKKNADLALVLQNN